MNRLSFAVAASLLLMPMQSLAAYSSPADLMAAVQENSVPHSFSVTAHAMSDGTYISVWASGTGQGRNPATMKATTKATVDVVKGKLKIRAKAELLATDGVLYARLVSLDGSYMNAFASVSGMLKQQLWVSMPLDEAMLESLTGGNGLNMTSSMDPSEADHMFHMQSKAGKNGGTVYTLSLTQDFAVTLAQLIREMLNDNSSASDDFFPWRQLAEGMRFESTIVTDAKDAFVSSAFSLSTSSNTSSLTINGTEKRLGGSLAVKAPANAVTMDQALASFADLENDVPGSMMPEEIMMQPTMPSVDVDSMVNEDATFDSVDEATTPTYTADCNDPSLSPQQLFTLQRGGFCPTAKKSTRYGGW